MRDSVGEQAFRILQLWYKEAYEEVSRQYMNEREMRRFWEERSNALSRSRDMLLFSNRALQSRLEAQEEFIDAKQRLIDEIFRQFPEVRDSYEIVDEASDDETEEEDFRTVRRRLDF